MSRRDISTKVDIPGLLDPTALPALLVDEKYHVLVVNGAYKARFGHLAHPGQHCYEVSHLCPRPCTITGGTCPLSCARRTGRTCRVVHVHPTPMGDQHTSVTVRPVGGPNHGRRFLFLERVLDHVAAEPDVRRPVGRSPAFIAVIAQLERVSAASTPVVFVGEAGTGKSLMARTLHAMGPRRLGPFVAVECRRCGPELFGSAPSPTGGHPTSLIDAARGGTLFLHGVEFLPPALQGAILRLIEHGTYLTADESSVVSADVRVVGSAYRPIGHLMDNAVRRDLADALEVYPVWVPPLRERTDDIPLLVKSLLWRLPADVRARAVSARALAALQRYVFPGNVRELAGIVERASLLADAGVIGPEHLPVEVFEEPTDTAAGAATPHRRA